MTDWQEVDDMGLNKPHSSVVGDIVRETYRWIVEGGGSPDHEVYNPVNFYNIIPAKRFFMRLNNPRDFTVNPEHLPLNVDVRAISYFNRQVLTETTKIDWNALPREFEERKLPSEVHAKSIFYNGEKIIHTRTQNVGRGRPDIRTVLNILPEYKTQPWEIAIDSLDAIWNGDSFSGEGAEDLGVPVTQELRQLQIMSQEQQQQIRMLQRPELMFKMGTAYIVARRAHHAGVLKMNTGTLLQHLGKAVQTNLVLKKD